MTSQPDMAHPLSPAAAAAGRTPLEIAAQGVFWVGVERQTRPSGEIAAGQMFVQYQIPVQQRCPWPLVLVHGGGGQGTDYLGTPDGRPGWAELFLRMGYAVYVVDRPGHGRAPYHPDALGPMTPLPTYPFIEGLFTAPERAGAYPQASLHDQWPQAVPPAGGTALDQMLAGMGPSIGDLAATHGHMQRCGAALLDLIGPSILLTHSAGGPFGWVVTDARPGLVKAVVAVEPIGPPFMDRPGGGLDWGLTAIPLSFDPPAADPSELARELRPAPGPGQSACLVQAEPARRLPNLAGVPMVVVTGEASWMAQDNHGAVDFLRQAGCAAEHLRLEHEGVRGNGHMMMLEANSDVVAAVIDRWIASRVGRGD